MKWLPFVVLLDGDKEKNHPASNGGSKRDGLNIRSYFVKANSSFRDSTYLYAASPAIDPSPTAVAT